MNFLQNIDLNGNQLQNFLVHPTAIPPSVAELGMMYFNTRDTILRPLIFTGNWEKLAYMSDIESLNTSITSGYAALSDFTALKEKVDAFLDGDVNSDGILENLKEIQSFLDNYDEEVTLSTAINAIQADVTALKGYFNGGIAVEAAKVSNALQFSYLPQGKIDYIKSFSFDGSSIRSLILVSGTGMNVSINPIGDNAFEAVISTYPAYYNVRGTVMPLWYNSGDVTYGTSQGAFSQALAVNGRTAVAGRYYGVEVDTDGRLFVNVPWVNITADTIKGADASLVRKYTGTINAGSSTSYIVTHGLGKREVAVAIYDPDTYEQVMADVVATSTSEVTIVFASAPSKNYIIVVIG